MSIWGDCSVAVMDSVLCFLHMVDTKQLLMYCREVQQFTDSKKYHYCTLSHEIEQQWPVWRKWIKFMQFKCWCHLCPASMSHPPLWPFCRVPIHGSYGIQKGGSDGADFGVSSGPICPQSIKTASAAWNCDQHHHHYCQWVAVLLSSLI